MSDDNNEKYEQFSNNLANAVRQHARKKARIQKQMDEKDRINSMSPEDQHAIRRATEAFYAKRKERIDKKKFQNNMSRQEVLDYSHDNLDLLCGEFLDSLRKFHNNLTSATGKSNHPGVNRINHLKNAIEENIALRPMSHDEKQEENKRAASYLKNKQNEND